MLYVSLKKLPLYIPAHNDNTMVVYIHTYIHTYLALPEVDDVVLFAVDVVGVEDDVRVSTEELAVHLGVHWGHLKVLNAPHLHAQHTYTHSHYVWAHIHTHTSHSHSHYVWVHTHSLILWCAIYITMKFMSNEEPLSLKSYHGVRTSCLSHNKELHLYEQWLIISLL